MNQRLLIAAGVSVALHAGAGAALWGFGERPVALVDASPPPATVELVMREEPNRPQAPETPPPTQPQKSETPTKDRAAEADPSAEPIPGPRPNQEAQPAPPKPPTPPQPQSPMKVDLSDRNQGNSDSAASITVTGEHVVPARVDDAARNRSPDYPVDAARRREEGVVTLAIHIAPNGAATGSDVVRSSGSPRLDKAARDAVAKWRFRPSTKDGQPVASEIVMNFMFSLE